MEEEGEEESTKSHEVPNGEISKTNIKENTPEKNERELEMECLQIRTQYAI